MKAAYNNNAAPAFAVYADDDDGSHLATVYRLLSLEQQLAVLSVAVAMANNNTAAAA